MKARKHGIKVSRRGGEVRRRELLEEDWGLGRESPGARGNLTSVDYYTVE